MGHPVNIYKLLHKKGQNMGMASLHLIGVAVFVDLPQQLFGT